METLIDRMVAQRYLCKKKIGSGGMGAVYLAEDTKLQRKVVLKILLPNIKIKKAASRFLREAKLLSQLNHPHIVTIHDFGTWEEISFIVMEFLEGQTLHQVIQTRNPLPTPWIMNMLSQVMDALEAAHQAGIIHRDLKPANIFCLPQPGRDDYIKILDFGAALPADQDIRERLTTGGEVIGTPHYMSPEQIMGKDNITTSADIYSLGVILYEMLSGTPPFLGKKTMEVLLAHLYKAPEPLDMKNAEDDPRRRRLYRLVGVCLNKNPEDRYGSIGQLQEALTAESETAPRLAENLSGDRQRRYEPYYQGPIDGTRHGGEKFATIPLQRLRIMVIEDKDLAVEQSILPLLKTADYPLEVPPSVERDELRRAPLPNMIILNKGQGENLELLQHLGEIEEWQPIPFLVCGHEGDLDHISRAIESGASDYLSFPFDPKEIVKKIERLYKNRR